MIRADFSNILCKINWDNYKKSAEDFETWCENEKHNARGMIGWIDWASNIEEDYIANIEKVARSIRETYDVVVVVGVGGSYLGAHCAIDALNGLFPKDKIEVVYLGNTMSANYISQVLGYLADKKFAVIIISKSGRTLEPACAFRLLKDLLYKKMGANFKDAIFAITDEKKGALRQEVNQNGYVSFSIPSNIGGRYSVITAVGLLPMAVAGIDIRKFLSGVKQAEIDFANSSIERNPCYQYAAIRGELKKQGKLVELFATYEPQLRFFCEWLKQLFGESEGKSGKGILPISAIFTTDLHSFGQFIQDGTPCLFETVINIEKCDTDVILNNDTANLDGLNQLVGKSMHYINSVMVDSVVKAHADGGVSNILLTLPRLDETNLGYLMYLFMKACVFSCFLSGVNPFDQPGVEVYKKNAL